VSETVIPITAIVRTERKSRMRPAVNHKPCATRSCGDATPAANLSAEIREKIKDHPCYSEDAHHFYARIHVAVAPACNIQCNYCNRKYDCANESRPGVVSERLTPEQATRKVLAAAARLPQLSVVGIAGPGDALANPKRTFETFARIVEVLPDAKFCLSTNGLALPDHVAAITAHNVNHVTITINAVDPEVGAEIYPWVAFGGRRWTGVEGARILLERQLEGLTELVAAGVLVKVNSVMIPGINDEHLVEVNAAVMARGVFLHNIMPLISDPSHGTHFGLTGQRGPTAAELQALQDKLAGDARLMRHCRQCRADAVGLLGEDLGQEFTTDRLPAAAQVDLEKRRAYRQLVERERDDRRSQKEAALATLQAVGPEAPTLVAVCSKGGGRVNQHFGHATEFQVYEAARTGLRFIGTRRADRYCQGGDGEDDVLDATIAALSGVSLVLCAKIGRCPSRQLAAAGIRSSDGFALHYIETAIAGFFAAEAAAEAQTGKRA
jgi:nitrogen fixation protein NifB